MEKNESQEPTEEYFGPRFLARLHERLHRNPVTGVLTKIVVTIAGVVVILAGVVMMVTPGPGILGLVLGLAVLSTEWRWADRWLDWARAKASDAARAAKEMDPAVRRRRIAIGLLSVLAIVGGVAAWLHFWGWPQFLIDGWDWIQAWVDFVPELPGMP